MNPLAEAEQATLNAHGAVDVVFNFNPSTTAGNVRSSTFILSLVASYKIVNETYSKKVKKISLFLFYLCLSLFVSTSLSLSVSHPLCSCSLTDNVLPSFTPLDSLTNHVARRCLLSNTTNQADSEEPEVNRHGRSRDSHQPIRLY